MYEFGLPRDSVKLRFRGARAKRANTNAVGLHFLREAFRKEQIESLGRGIRGNVGNRLK